MMKEQNKISQVLERPQFAALKATHIAGVPLPPIAPVKLTKIEDLPTFPKLQDMAKSVKPDQVVAEEEVKQELDAESAAQVDELDRSKTMSDLDSSIDGDVDDIDSQKA